MSLKERIQNVAMLEEDGAEVIEVVFALIAAVIMGAALIGIVNFLFGADGALNKAELNTKVEDQIQAGIDSIDDLQND